MAFTAQTVAANRPEVAPAWRYLRVRYGILALLCLMYFIAYIDRVNISVAAPLMSKELNLSKTELGLVFSVFAYPYTVMQIAGGWLGDRYGPRLVLFVLAVIWSAATILTGFIGGLTSLVAMRVLLGIGEGGAFPTATRAMTYWYPVHERGFAQGITHSFARLGGAVTPPIVLAVATIWGWRESFIIVGVISLIWAVSWYLIFRDTPEEKMSVSQQELKEIGIPLRKARGAKTPWREMISRMWLVTFVDFCYGWSLWVFLTWMPSYLFDARGFDIKSMAVFATLPLAAGVIGDTLGGVVSDGIYRATGNLRVARCTMLVVGLAGALTFLIPAVQTDDKYMAVYFLAASFFFLELTNAVLWSLPIDIAGRYAGTAGGMMNTGFGVAGMVSPVVFGVLVQHTGSYVGPFVITGGLLAVGILASLFINPNRKVAEPAV